jgi:hypothetical protein
MNNFDTKEKLDGIDKTIASVLDQNNIDWENQTLYSWGYTTGLDSLDILNVYARKNIVFNSASNKRISSHISARFVRVQSNDDDKFIMELSAILYKNTCPYNIVVSNIAPDKKAFDGHELHSAKGKWYTGLD